MASRIGDGPPGASGDARAGGHLLLRLSEQSDVVVVYAAELTADGAAPRGEARVKLEDGDVEFVWEGSGEAASAPDWLIEATRAALRTLWRARHKPAMSTSDAEPWPRRIKRWRLAPKS